MRFSSKSVEHIGIHMFSGAFLEKPVFHCRPSEASFFLGDVSCLMAVGKSKMVVGKSQREHLGGEGGGELENTFLGSGLPS